jgi:Flp pilus assembly protein TadB
MMFREQVDAAIAAGCAAALGAWIGSEIWAFVFVAVAGGVLVSLSTVVAERGKTKGR